MAAELGSPVVFLFVDDRKLTNKASTSFPERLKALRKQFGYTQNSLGKRINVSAAAINRYEKGLRKPDPDMLCLLADLFETSVDELLGREKKK